MDRLWFLRACANSTRSFAALCGVELIASTPAAGKQPLTQPHRAVDVTSARKRAREKICEPVGQRATEAADLHLVVMNGIRELGDPVDLGPSDDEIYLCGAIMAMAAAADCRVVCVTATRGELGVTDPQRWPPEQLPTIREAELAECLRILGVTEHHWLGYPDGGCDSADADAAVERIAGILRAVRPDTVLTFPPDGQTGHPDHIAVHRWTLEAVRRTGIGACRCRTQEWPTTTSVDELRNRRRAAGCWDWAAEH
jgi:hypothetical protein